MNKVDNQSVEQDRWVLHAKYLSESLDIKGNRELIGAIRNHAEAVSSKMGCDELDSQEAAAAAVLQAVLFSFTGREVDLNTTSALRRCIHVALGI